MSATESQTSGATTAAASLGLSAVVVQDRFREVLHFARQTLGERDLATQRQLADALGIAPTMTGRYLNGIVDFYSLRAITVLLLSRAAKLDPGSLFTWIEEGREAAFAHESQVRGQPASYSAVAHLRVALSLLEGQEQTAKPEEHALPACDFEGLERELAARRGAPDSQVAKLFDSLVVALNGQDTLERISSRQELEEHDWAVLKQLLFESAEELQRRFAPGVARQTAAKISQQAA